MTSLYDEGFDLLTDCIVVTTQPDGTGLKAELLNTLPEEHYFRGQIGYAITCARVNTQTILATILPQKKVSTSLEEVVQNHTFLIEDLELSKLLEM